MSHHRHRHGGTRGHGDHRGALAAPGQAQRLGGAVNAVLKASLGAGAAVLGAYVLQRGRKHADLADRLDRLDALVKEMEKKGGNGAGA
jgi:hypothetical protein